MLLKIAWRNIWRNKGRSFVVMGAVILGIWAVITGNGFMNGFMVSYTANVINHDISHVQVHHPEFKVDYDLKFVIHDGKERVEQVRLWPEVKGATSRSIVNGMIASARKASGVQIRGVDIENEAIVTHLDSLVKEGEYFQGIRKNPVIIGKKLAKTLSVKLRSKVVLTFTDANGDITAAAFRVVGIAHSSSLSINERFAFVRQTDLNTILGIGSDIHEIAILIKTNGDELKVANTYNNLYGEDKAETWKEIEPTLALMEALGTNTLYVLMSIIMIALAFGILNTMLMAVLERIRELGMLMAVGMTKLRVFMMVVIETVYLCLAGAPLGLLAGKVTIDHYSSEGVDLSRYSEGLEAFGYPSMLYPSVTSDVYLIVTIAVAMTAVLAALYPAWKAVKLRPVEALHKI